jgi:hypothetical protein
MSFVISSAGCNYANPSKIGGTGSGIKIFPSLLNSAAPAVLQILEQQQGQTVVLNASGSIFVHGTSPTIIPTLQSGTSLTSGSNTTISVLTSAQSLATNATYPWSLTVKLQGDATSGVVQVVSTSFSCNGVNSTSFTNTSLTGVTFSGLVASPPVFAEVGVSLVLGINFTVSDSLNSASLFQYTLEA